MKMFNSFFPNSKGDYNDVPLMLRDSSYFQSLYDDGESIVGVGLTTKIIFDCDMLSFENKIKVLRYIEILKDFEEAVTDD